MSADVDLDTVGSCILFYCRDQLLVIHVLLLFSGFMNLTSRPTSRLADGVGSHALGDLTGDPHAATLRDLSPEVATSSRQYLQTSRTEEETDQLHLGWVLTARHRSLVVTRQCMRLLIAV